MTRIAIIKESCIRTGFHPGRMLSALAVSKCTGVVAIVALLGFLLTIPAGLRAQNVIGGTTGDPSAVLELQSTNAGLLLPRMTLAERNAIASPAEGLLIYNMTLACIELNMGSSSSPNWQCLVGTGKIASLNCAGASLTGTLQAATPASGVSLQLPYTGGNGYQYKSLSAVSTGITGLTATLPAGAFVQGNGSLSLAITGTPSGVGTASFALTVAGQSCTVDVTVNLPLGQLTAIDCEGATANKLLLLMTAASNTNVSVGYTGGNGGTIVGETVASTGITGLTATLGADTLAVGSGTLVYTISGTPAQNGSASFALNVGGQSCTLNLRVVCGAFVAAGQTKEYMCHNLGANTSVDPLTPSWELNGNYYQWGRNPTCFGRDGTDATNPCSSPIYGVAAPWGNTTANDNAGSITGWNTTIAPNNTWADSVKTANDPCPSGFRVPTNSQLAALANSTLNPRTSVGTWTAGSTQYGTGRKFGKAIFLPAAGYRSDVNGSLGFRGRNGLYWNSSGVSGSNAQSLFYDNSAVGILANARLVGGSVRCIAE